MYLQKRKDGAFVPSSEADYEEAKKIQVGFEVKATKARNTKFHRKAFALLNLAFENQDKFDNFEIYRKVITIRSGYYNEIPDENGVVMLIPQSLSYEKMSAEKFDKWYNDTLEVISKDMQTAPQLIQQQITGFY